MPQTTPNPTRSNSLSAFPEKISILLVDDRPENLIALGAVLDSPDYHLVKAGSGKEALRHLLEEDFALILLDVQMPGMDGFECAKLIKQRERSKLIPIIFVTAISKDEPFIFKGYDVGAVDYLFKPFEPQILRSKVAVFADLHRKNLQIRRQSVELREKDRIEREREIAHLELQSLRRDHVAQQKYRHLVDGIDHGIVWLADPAALSFSFVSPKAEVILGYQLSQWENVDFFHQIIHPDDRSVVERAIRSVSKQVPEASFEHRCVKSDGQLLWFHTDIRRVERADSSVAELQGLSVDITHLKEAEFRLRDSELRTRTLFETIPQIIWIARTDSSLEYVNQKWTNYTGLTFEQSTELGWKSALHPDDAERVSAAWKNALAGGAFIEFEYRLKGVDGAYRWFLVRADPVRDLSGKIEKFFGTATDIDVTKKLEWSSNFLSEATAVLSSSLEHTTTLNRVAELAVPALADWCTIELHEQGKPQHVAIAHVDPQKVKLGHDLQARFPPDWSPESPRGKVFTTGKAELYREVSDELLRASTTSEDHYALCKELGLRSAMIVPLNAAGRTIGIMGFFYSESRHSYSPSDLILAEELGRRAALAVQNSRLYAEAQEAIRARDEFLSIASHELNTPLTPLRLQIQTLKRMREKGLPVEKINAKLNQMFETLDRQIERLSRLVTELLDVSRINDGKLMLDPETFDFVELVKEVSERYEQELRKIGCELTLDLQGPAVGKWDRLRMEQVFVNLLTNAMKYAPGKPIHIKVWLCSPNVVLEVHDRGMGISKQDQARIFERFERAVSSSNFGGLGLGLYIVMQILRAHRGKISVESEPGEGSVFCVELPTDAFGAEGIEPVPLTHEVVASPPPLKVFSRGASLH